MKMVGSRIVIEHQPTSIGIQSFFSPITRGYQGDYCCGQMVQLWWWCLFSILQCSCPLWLREGDQNSANVCPCACRTRRLIMGYKLSYATGLLHALSSSMQWGVWVWTVRHWVVLVQVIYFSKGGWVLYLEPIASLRGDRELQPQA